MRALTPAAVWLVVVCSSCATAPAPFVDSGLAGADSAGTVWGDEYEDHYVNPEETVRDTRGLNAEWVDGDTRSARVDAFAEGARVRVRSSRTGEVGMVSWHGDGLLREITAGDVAPAVAEGALIGDLRTSADLRAPSSTRAEGLRLPPSSSPWSALRGGGVVVAPGSFRIGAGVCEVPDDPERRAGFASIERHAGHATVGVAGGAVTSGTSPRGAGSIYLARDDGVTFASGEVAVASGQVRSVARLVAGEQREWSAVAIAGAGPARDEPLVFTRRERWGAALERRDGWNRGACRTGVSSLDRRDADTDVRRRRFFWDGVWRVSNDARLELGTRVTREHSGRASSGVFTEKPEYETNDEWRARMTLRAERAWDGGARVENAYRLEWVQNRSGRPGTIVTWTCRLRTPRFDGRLSATAHALATGQVAYQPETAPLSGGEYTAVAGKGASLAASLHVPLGTHAWLGATWSKRPPTESRFWISAGFRT